MISASVAVLGSTKFALENEVALGSVLRFPPLNEACCLRLVAGFNRDLVEGSSRVLFRAATASLDRGLLLDCGVRGRDIDGGSEARESTMPEILNRSPPSNFRSSNIVSRWFKE